MNTLPAAHHSAASAPNWRRGDPPKALITREWLVTNALGGFASGTVGGVLTRRYHGLLIAALGSPAGRVLMLNRLDAALVSPDGSVVSLSPAPIQAPEAAGSGSLVSFTLDL